MSMSVLQKGKRFLAVVDCGTLLVYETASMFRPRMTDMGVSFLRCVGLHKSTNQPSTPYKRLVQKAHA